MGYLYAILSSLFFAFYAVPKKRVKLKPNIYVFFMGISCFLVSLSLYLLFGLNEVVFDKCLLWSIGGGVIWFIASVLFFISVDKMGVARASEFKSLQGPIGSLLMLIILSEYISLNIYLLLLAIIFIFLSAMTLVIKDDSNYKMQLKSIITAVLAALFYGLTGFIRKVVTIQGFVYIQQVYTSIGLVLAAFIFLIIKDKKVILKKEEKRSYLLAMLSGLFYYFASYFMLLSYKKIEGSIAFPIIQLNSVWAGIIGVLIFKEIDYKKYYKRLLLGLLFAILGITLLVICN